MATEIGPYVDDSQTVHPEARATAIRREAGLAAAIEAIRREREESAGAVLELLALSPAERKQAAREDLRFRSLEVAARLLERGCGFLAEDSREAEALARLALHVTDHVMSATCGDAAVRATRAWAWALVAESRRMRGEHIGAEEAFSQAGKACRVGPDSYGEVWLRRLLCCLPRERRERLEALSPVVSAAGRLLAEDQ